MKKRWYLFPCIVLFVILVVALSGCQSTAIPSSKPTSATPSQSTSAAPSPSASAVPSQSASATQSAPSTSQAAAATINWKFWVATTSTHTYVSNVYKPFVDELKQKTNGRFVLTMYTAGELPYKGIEILSAVKSKQLELGECLSHSEEGELPFLKLWALPFINTSLQEHQAIKDVLLKPTEALLNQQFNVHWMFNGIYPATQVFTSKAVNTLADLKGLKIRTVSPEEAEVINTLGAVGVSMTTPDVYTAMQRGTVDGAEASYMSLQSNKWFELVKYGYEWNDAIAPSFMAVNLDTYNSLPADVKKTFDEVAAKYQTVWYDAGTNYEQKSKKEMGDTGGKFVVAPDKDKQQVLSTVKPLWSKWAGSIDKGPALLEQILKGTNH